MTNTEAIRAATADMTYEEKLLVYRLLQELHAVQRNSRTAQCNSHAVRLEKQAS